MISIDEALQLIRRHARSLPARQMELASLAGHRLAEPVVSDVDSPPFDKAMMDGVAIRAADFADGIRDYECVGEILAGGTSELILGPGQAIRIMTGAPVPDGANAVVMVEETVARQRDGRPFVELTSSHCVSGQNILRRRETMAVGQSIFGPGHLVRAHDTGVMAEAGVVQAQVIPRPGLAVIATGDELVSVDSIPINSQIRNSNGPMVAAMAGPWCRDVADLGIAPDDGVRLASLISQGLQSSVLVLSGGVSAGAADLVPQVLADAGVQQIFHKVAIKPGKPIWFGQLTRDPDPPTLVFGLPGNPVSSMCCFHIFVRPALQQLAGSPGETAFPLATLTRDHRQRPGRTTFWPSALAVDSGGQSRVEPLDWKGSADLLTLSAANCFAVFDGDQSEFVAGTDVPVFRLP